MSDKCIVTIVCCYNDTSVYNNFVASLQNQTCPYKLIGINNGDNAGFSSCAAAYNSVISNVDTKYVIYSHQDILLKDADSLKKFVAYLEKISEDDILGVAGVKFDETGMYSNIVQRINWTGKLCHAGPMYVEGMIPCDTLDECFFGGYSGHFSKHPFDEKLCDNWHLYAVERCLNTKAEGNSVYVCDVFLFHLSSGNVNSAFVKGFYEILKHYADKFPFIRTTCACSRTNLVRRVDFLFYNQSSLYRFIRNAYSFVRVKIEMLLRLLGLRRVSVE